MNKVICVGSSSKDIFFPNNKGLILDTPEDLTSKKKLAFELGAKFQVDKIFEAPGGCAANVSQGMARLGLDVGCYTKIGKDLLGEWILDEIKKEGVDTSFVQIDENCTSDLSAIIVDEKSKDHIIFFNRDANTKLEIIPEKINSAKWLFVSALNGDWANHLDKIEQIAKDNEVQIAFTPGQRNIEDNAKRIIEFIQNCDVLVVNKDEAIGIMSYVVNSDNENLNQEKFLVEELLKLGARVVTLTDGERGAWGSDGGDVFHAKALKKDAVDTLGAGDAFTSGFLSGFIKGQSLEKCLRWGIVNGGNVVMFYGAKEGLLRSDEIDAEAQKIEVVKL
ncbi:MAG: carbohydrate kinase family protein [Candidatus Moranbacteria bacterium]|nr:carbohydrate kinase family protein [Candidatus Moranbacteria bacterium]